MRKTTYIITLIAALFTISSCDLINRATTANIPVGDFDVAFEMPIDGISPASTKAETLYAFEGEYTLTSDDPCFAGAMEYAKYKKLINDVDMESVTMTLTSDENSDGYVSDLKLIIANGSGETVETVTIAKYTLGEEYTNKTELKSAINAAMDEVLNYNKVIFKVTGNTNIESGTFQFNLAVRGVVVKVSLLSN